MNQDFLQHTRAEEGLPAPHGASGEWGRFEGDVVCRWDDDGRTMTVLEPFVYIDPRCLCWRVTAGTRIDGASIPRAFWSVIGGPYEIGFRSAAVVHGAACKDLIRPWRSVHRMFYEACRCSGVDAPKAKMMYYAVFHFGPRWHTEERSSLAAGIRHVDVIIRNDTPAPPTEVDVAKIVDYFVSHQVAAQDIPTLDVLDSGD